MSTALKWSKQISVLRFVSVDMFMIIETKVFLREFDNFNYESFDLYLALSRILHGFQTIDRRSARNVFRLMKRVKLENRFSIYLKL